MLERSVSVPSPEDPKGPPYPASLRAWMMRFLFRRLRNSKIATRINAMPASPPMIPPTSVVLILGPESVFAATDGVELGTAVEVGSTGTTPPPYGQLPVGAITKVEDEIVELLTVEFEADDRERREDVDERRVVGTAVGEATTSTVVPIVVLENSHEIPKRSVYSFRTAHPALTA